MAVTSVADFFKLLEKSSLLSADQLQAARKQWSGETDPKTVARKLLTEGRLTKWQALQLLNGRSALTIGPYRLRDAMPGDNVVRVFRAQHAESGQLVELRSLSRGHAAERPEALEEFVADAEKTASSSGRKIIEVHRPDAKDESCYVVLEEAGSGVTNAAAPSLSDSSAIAEAVATAAAGAEQASEEKPAGAPAEKPAVPESAKPPAQEAVSASAGSETRPPKLKPKAKPAESAPAQAEAAAAEAKDVPAASAEAKVAITIPGQDAAVPVTGAPAEFKIARGKRRKSGKAPPDRPAKPAAADKAVKPAAAEAAEGDAAATPAPAPSSKLAMSPRLLIGGAVGGGLLLVAVVVVAWLVFFRGGSTEVADAGSGNPPAEQAKEAPQEGEAKPDEAAAKAEPAAAEPGDPVVSDPVVEVQPEMPAGAESKPEAQAEPAAAKTEPAAPEAKPAEPAASPAAEPGKEPATSKPAAEPAKPDATKPEPAAKEPAGKEPAAKETPAKEPAAKEATANKPAEKEADKKPPAPPPGKKPFADLKALATLPDTSDTKPVVLGPVYVPAGELCFIKLRGGEKARKGVQHLIMKNANEGLADKDWEISVRDAAGAETVVALLKLNDQSQLVFQWGPNAKTQDLAPYMCNCALALTCAGESKAITFREAVPVEALAVDFSKPNSKKDWPIKMCPDPEVVRFQITGVQGAKFSVEPAEPMPAKKETAWVKIEDGGGMLSLKVDASLTNDFQLTASPHIKLSAEASKPDKFVRRMFENNLKQAQTQSEMIKQRVQAMQQYAKGPAKDAKQVEQNLPAFELDARNAETLLQNMKKIDDLLKSLSEGMKIQFRVFYDADSTEVVLLKSG